MQTWFRGLGRLGATGIIWVMIGGIAITSIVTGDGVTSGSVIIIAMGFAFGYATTEALWKGEATEEKKANRAEQVGKRKRSEGESKAEVLLALMDDDEREAFKQALKARLLSEASRSRLTDDGELDIDPAIADLLDEQYARRR